MQTTGSCSEDRGLGGSERSAVPGHTDGTVTAVTVTGACLNTEVEHCNRTAVSPGVTVKIG